MPHLSAQKSGLTVLSPKDEFRFECHPGLECFTRCCHDTSIFLTPYDIVRMKSALHISSSEFLSTYTATMISETGIPIVVLKMQSDAAKSCPFVGAHGCCIYNDRPWACRIYPLKPESTKITENLGKTYYSVLDVPFCRGFDHGPAIPVAEWIEGQDIPDYQEMEAPFKKITADERLGQNKISNRNIQEMFYMACYDVDRFRRFVLETTFLERFDIDPREVEAIQTDDAALVRLALRWLEYGLLAHNAMTIKDEVMAAAKQKMGIE